MSTKPTAPQEDPIRPHVFDGIAEFDKKMPNWWLNLFYITIVFGIIYWLGVARFGDITPQERVDQAMARIEAIRLAGNTSFDDETLWKMSRNATIVEEGRKLFAANCTACHGADLKGGIGANLVDGEWIHGGNPTQVFHTVENGVLDKGMQAWGPMLGPKKVAEVVAFVLSHHQPAAQ